MEKNWLSEYGWVILQQVVDTTDARFVDFLHETRKFKPIFNSEYKRDKKRSQVVLPGFSSEPWASTLVEKLQNLVPGLTMHESALLRSAKGCARQRRHTDYEVAAVEACKVKPHSVLIAVSDKAQLHVCERNTERTLEIEPGDAILFRGDVVHSGAAYADANTRLFGYLDSPELPRTPDTTYFAPKVWCYCGKADDHELYVECSGGERCPYGGWVHHSCAGFPDLQEPVFTCSSCAGQE